NGAGTDIDALTDLGIADIGQVVDLGTGTDHRLLGLDEVADLGLALQYCAGPQPRVGPDVTVLTDLGALQVAEGLDHAAGPDHRIADHAVGFNGDIVLDHHPAFEQHVDVDANITTYADFAAHVQPRRIRQRGTLGHQPLGFTGLPGTFQHRQLLAVVGTHDLQLIAGLHHADLYRLVDRQLDHIGEVVLALGVVVRQPGQPGLYAAARQQHDAGIALADLQLFRTGVLLFNDGLHLPLGVAQDAPVAGGIAQQHGEHAEAVHRSLLDQRLEGVHGQQRHITIE